MTTPTECHSAGAAVRARRRRVEALCRSREVAILALGLFPSWWPLALPPRRSGIDCELQPTDQVAVQLVEAAGLRDACDLDLLLFFSRHPRVVLTSEQLAAYVGYELQQVARALDLLLRAGLLQRRLNQGAPGRMYVLEVSRPEEWLEPLRHVCATPDGRNALKALLKRRQTPNGTGNDRRPSGVRPS
jgi:MarR family